MQPLVLVLEDLHWSDASTVEVLALLARRREAARLLVLGTYRPVEVIVHAHPLKAVKQELVAHGQAVEVPLGDLGPEAVAAYLAQREDTAAAPVRTWRRWSIGAPRAIRCSWCRWWTLWRSRAAAGAPSPGAPEALEARPWTWRCRRGSRTCWRRN